MQTSRRNAELTAPCNSIESTHKGKSSTGQVLRFAYDDSFAHESNKVAWAMGEIHVREFGKMNDDANDIVLLDALEAFVRKIDSCDSETSTVHSFVALFSEPTRTTEIDFENKLWMQLYSLHLLDIGRSEHAATAISANPDGSQFNLRLAGHQFFVIGLHAGSSRVARKFQRPVLVFNSHKQFELLRTYGHASKLQKVTQQSESTSQGYTHPYLAEFSGNGETKVGRDESFGFYGVGKS